MVGLSQVNADISEDEIIQRAGIAVIELNAKRIIPSTKRTKSTVYFSQKTNSKLNAIKEFLGITRQDLVEEAVDFYLGCAIYSKHNISLTDTQKPLMIKGFFTFKLKPIYN